MTLIQIDQLIIGRFEFDKHFLQELQAAGPVQNIKKIFTGSFLFFLRQLNKNLSIAIYHQNKLLFFYYFQILMLI